MSVCARVVMTVAIAACSYDRPTLALDDAGGSLDSAAPDGAIDHDAATASDAGAPCTFDQACPSQVCSADGCVDPSAVRYVGPIGTDNGPCTQREPCRTMRKPSV